MQSDAGTNTNVLPSVTMHCQAVLVLTGFEAHHRICIILDPSRMLRVPCLGELEHQ